MLEKVVMKKKHDWDIYLPMLLFVYREIQHETTGYSPFELLFGRVVKSPISNLKEKWINSKPVKQYPFELINKIQDQMRYAAKVAVEKDNEKSEKALIRLNKNRFLTYDKMRDSCSIFHTYRLVTLSFSFPKFPT